jgi:hypothetical protein
MVLKGMTDILFVIGRCYGMEMNAEKKLRQRKSQVNHPLSDYSRLKQLENVEYFN